MRCLSSGDGACLLDPCLKLGWFWVFGFRRWDEGGKKQGNERMFLRDFCHLVVVEGPEYSIWKRWKVNWDDGGACCHVLQVSNTISPYATLTCTSSASENCDVQQKK